MYKFLFFFGWMLFPNSITAICISGNCFNGFGEYHFSSGDVYRGEFEGRELHGKGIMEFHNGNKYLGYWKQGKRHGKGKLIFSDGAYYEGDFVNNFFEGVGEYYYQNGDIYQGQFRSNLPSGEGTFYFHNGEEYYGQFVDGLMEGEGTYSFPNGRIISGEWKQNKLTTYEVISEASDFRFEQSNTEKTQSREIPIMDPDAEHENDSKIYAVVVGIAQYNHMPSLKYTDDDAYRMYAFLKSPEGGALPDDQISVLIDEMATSTNILSSMKNLFSKADDNDQVLLYFSGHGLKGSFVPYDFDGKNNLLEHNQLYHLFDQAKAKNKICYLDACYSGSYMGNKGKLEDQIESFYTKLSKSQNGTATLMSSQQNESSLEYGGLRQGVFSHFLMQGLKGKADSNRDKIVTITEIYNFINQGVVQYTSKAQKPIISGDFDPNMPVAFVRQSD